MLSHDSGDVLSAEAGCKIPTFSLVAMDGFGNRTAPSTNAGWKVTWLFGCRVKWDVTLKNVAHNTGMRFSSSFAEYGLRCG